MSDFSTDDLLVRATERIAFTFTDVRGVYGSDPPELTMAERKAQAWAYIERQWELWPRPDLVRAILPPAFTRPSRRFLR